MYDRDVRWVALVVLLAGCDKVWLTENALPAEAGVDGAMDATPDALVTCGDGTHGTVIERQDFTDEEMLAATFIPRANTNGSSVLVVARQLVATPGKPIGYGEIESKTLRSFSGLIAQVRVESAAALDNTDTFFDIHTPANDRVYFSIGPVQIEMAVKFANGSVTQVGYVNYLPEFHRYLRLEQRGSNFIFFTSASGSDWTEQHRATITSFNLSQVGVRMGVGAYGSGTQVSSTAVFDDFELCGP